MKPRHFPSLIEKCRERLEGWSSHTLSFSGRVELIKITIHGIVSYWVHSCHLPISFCRNLDKLCSNFLWKGKMHARSWRSICKTKSEGGIGLRSFQDVNKASSCKRLWNYCTSNTIWVEWMRLHYKKQYSIWVEWMSLFWCFASLVFTCVSTCVGFMFLYFMYSHFFYT